MEQDNNQRIHVEKITAIIAVLVTVIGAFISLSNFLDWKVITGFFEKLGNAAWLIKIISVLLASLLVSTLASSSLHLNFLYKKKKKKKKKKLVRKVR